MKYKRETEIFIRQGSRDKVLRIYDSFFVIWITL